MRPAARPSGVPGIERRGRAAVAASVIMLPALLAAQAVPAARCAPDSFAVSEVRPVFLALAPAGPDLRAVAADSASLPVLQAIAQRFAPPAEVSLPFWAWTHPKTSRPDAATLSPTIGMGLDDFIVLRFRPDGRLADRRIEVSTASPALNLSILEAILMADDERAFPRPGPATNRDGARVRLRLVDTSRVHTTAVPLMTIAVPRIRTDEEVRQTRPPRLRYPNNGRFAAIEEDVELQFVVDTTGRVLPGSVRVIRGKYLDFIELVIEGLAEARYAPARMGNCPVPMLVHQRFAFRMRR